MLDLRFVREHLDEIRVNVKNRRAQADPDLVVRLYDERNALQQRIDAARAARNANAEKMKAKLVARGAREARGRGAAPEGRDRRPRGGVRGGRPEADRGGAEAPEHEPPRGADRRGRGGEPARSGPGGSRPSSPSRRRTTSSSGRSLDLIDFDAGARVAGQKFYYLKNEAVLLEQSLVRYALDILREEGFTLLSTPDIAREEIVAGHGFTPRGEESNIYTIEGTDLCLIATAEITLGGYHAGQVLDAGSSPLHAVRAVALLPPRGGRRGPVLQGALPGAPVHQGRDVRVLPPLGLGGDARPAGRHRGAHLPGARAALPDRGHLHRRPRRARVPQVRLRGVDAGPRASGASTARSRAPRTARTSRPGGWASGSARRGRTPSCTR